VHSSLGTGFRSPSLFELFGPFVGNPDLDPETSFSLDAGVEQSFLDGKLLADVTFFMLDIEDLIIFDTTTFTYQQTDGTTRSRGVEASLEWRANGWLDLGASYTYTHSELPDGERNIRVPRHAIGAFAAARPWERWTISAAAKAAIDTVDTGGFELDDYVVLNAKLAYKPTDETELYVRVENLLDQEYQTVRGFGTPGFSAFAGFKAVW
jgi:vitamin B12 transporter